MAEDTKNKEQETPAQPGSGKAKFGDLNSMDDNFIRDSLPTGFQKSADDTFAGVLKKTYGRSMIRTSKEFVGIVLRVIPKPYSFTQKLGPYYKILAIEAEKKGVEFVNNVLNQLTLVQVRVPELDSMIPDPPIYDVNLQLSNKPPDQLTDAEKRSITLIERHSTFVGWTAEGNTPPTVGSYVRVAYDNPFNRTGGRYLGTVVSSDGVVPSMGTMGSQAFADCMGNLGSAPAAPPKVSNPTPPPVTPTETAASGSAASASATPPPPIKATAPTPSPMENCVHLLGGGGFTGNIPETPAGMMGDPGGMSWSNRARQKTVRWKDTGLILRNGELELSGFLESDPKSGAKLIKPAMADFKRLAAAYEAKFPGKVLKGSGYRTYASQINVRMIRMLGDRANCPENTRQTNGVAGEGAGQYNKNCKFVGFAAIPGTSNHGWGAAVDIDRGNSGWTKGRKGRSPEFRWINKFAHKFNFVFGVTNEHWHIDWMPFSSKVEAVSGRAPKTKQTAWTKDGQNDDTITFT